MTVAKIIKPDPGTGIESSKLFWLNDLQVGIAFRFETNGEKTTVCLPAGLWLTIGGYDADSVVETEAVFS